MIHYKLTYTEQSQLFNNFGKGNWTVPMIVNREYEIERHGFKDEAEVDAYVMNLSDPQATKIEKKIGDGEWKQFYPKEVTKERTKRPMAPPQDYYEKEPDIYYDPNMDQFGADKDQFGNIKNKEE